MLQQAAAEYNKAEYKFYKYGFFKFVREGNATLLIEDIYVLPEFRGTPVSGMMMEEFDKFMKEEGILFYYGRVFKDSDQYKKRVHTFTTWGMTLLVEVLKNYNIVHGVVR